MQRPPRVGCSRARAQRRRPPPADSPARPHRRTRRPGVHRRAQASSEIPAQTRPPVQFSFPCANSNRGRLGARARRRRDMADMTSAARCAHRERRHDSNMGSSGRLSRRRVAFEYSFCEGALRSGSHPISRVFPSAGTAQPPIASRRRSGKELRSCAGGVGRLRGCPEPCEGMPLAIGWMPSEWWRGYPACELRGDGRSIVQGDPSGRLADPQTAANSAGADDPGSVIHALDRHGAEASR